MKRISILFLFCLLPLFGEAQEQVSEEHSAQITIRCTCTKIVDNSPLYILNGEPIQKEGLTSISPKSIVSIAVIKDLEALNRYGTQGECGVVLIKTKERKNIKCNAKVYPFKTYIIKNNNWVLQQDMYNAIEANVPSVRVSNRNNITKRPSVGIRGDFNTTVIVDGVRFNASILSTLNPNDIECIKVAPSIVATNYFLNNLQN
ncbi:TonB-dependent receptor plug domain-containing protein [Croceitalea marina]|uniref:TonB-dependent receptor plug domain-containing protein n=1 Tax=Croceitalea marina TaxID=1775166 RepID=A0ABW5MVN3_9FLAO